MKARIKYKVIAFVLCLTMLLTNAMPLSSSFVYGANTTENSIGSINQEDDGVNIGVDKTQNTNTSYSEEIDVESSQNTDVYVSQASTFGVFIPKVIVLDGAKNENGLNLANYVVSVSNYSNIGGMETINIVPDDSFEMTSYGKNPIVANVTQDKVSWKYNELDLKGNGVVSTSEMSAGIWNGKFNFNISLNGSLSSSITVIAKDENGVDLNASANEIIGTKKESLLNSLVESGLISSIDEVDALINVKSDEFDDLAETTFDVSSIAKQGDRVTILHFNENTNEWEFISTEIVDENGKISANFTSFSPVAFVKDNDYNNNENESLPPISLVSGMYTMDNELIKSWDELIDEGTISVSKSGVLTTSNATTNIYDKLVVDESVKTIGEETFKNCKNIKEIILGENLTTIYESAFYNCTALEKITLPVSTNFYGSIFYGTNSLKEITLLVGSGKGTGLQATSNSKVNYMTNTPWYNKTIDTIIIPEGVTSLGNYYFYKAKVTNFVLPSTLTTIGTNSFYNCTLTSDLIIPNDVTSIGSNAFYNVPHITYNGTATGSPWGALAIN